MPQWMALTGQSHAQMQGLGWLDAVHPDERARTHAAWTTAIAHTAPHDTDYRILCADGIYRWFDARGAPVLNKDGPVREWAGVCLNMPGRSRYDAPSSEASAAPSSPMGAGLTLDDGHLVPSQIRAARALTALSKDELAGLANVSVSTLHRPEDPGSAIRPRHDTVLSVRRALERAGVEFTFEPGRKPGVREA